MLFELPENTNMKYEIELHKSESKTVQIEAAGPHEAVIAARAENPGFHADNLIQMHNVPDDEPAYGDDYSVVSGCESCSRPILTGDKYFQWGGEDPVDTCLECGGADETHEPSVA